MFYSAPRLASPPPLAWVSFLTSRKRCMTSSHHWEAPQYKKWGAETIWLRCCLVDEYTYISAQRNLVVNMSYFEKLMRQFGCESRRVYPAHSPSSPPEAGWCGSCQWLMLRLPSGVHSSLLYTSVCFSSLCQGSISLGGIWVVSVIKSGFYFKPCCGSLLSPRVGFLKRNLETQIQ